MTRVIQIVFALLIIFFGLAFHIKNDLPVTLDFYVRTIPMPLSWVVVVAFSVGAVLGLMVMLNTILRLQREIRRLTKKHDMATKEIVNLRAIPINDAP
jgi:putative membrane protein